MTDRILVPIDFSGVSDAVVVETCHLAKALDASVLLVHVAIERPEFLRHEIGTVALRDSIAGHIKTEHRKLARYRNMLEDEGVEATAILIPGSPAEKILEEARRLEPALILLGSHGHGALFHLLLGSVCQAVLRKAPCPVLIVPSRAVVAQKLPSAVGA